MTIRTAAARIELLLATACAMRGIDQALESQHCCCCCWMHLRCSGLWLIAEHVGLARTWQLEEGPI